MKRVAAWAAAVMACWTLRGVAAACTCGKEVDLVRPGPADLAPLDTHVWVRGDDGRFADIKPTEPAEPLRLRLAGGAEVPTTVRFMVSHEASVAELIPKRPLAAGKSYEVVATDAKGVARVIGSFKTGTAIDQEPPRFAGVTRATFVHPTRKLEIVDVGGKKVYRIMVSTCSRDDAAYAVVDVATASDHGTRAEALGYGLWPAGTKDLTAPPLIVLSPDAPPAAANLGTPTTRLRLGAESTCDTSAHDFAADLAKLPRPRKKKAPKPALVHFTLAAIDLSGNRSAPVDLVLDLTKAVESPPP